MYFSVDLCPFAVLRDAPGRKDNHEPKKLLDVKYFQGDLISLLYLETPQEEKIMMNRRNYKDYMYFPFAVFPLLTLKLPGG